MQLMRLQMDRGVNKHKAEEKQGEMRIMTLTLG